MSAGSSADERGDLGGPRVVDALLLVDRRLDEVDQRRGVDVDVAVADGDRLAGQPPHALGRRLRVGRVLLGVELVVVALDEDRRRPAGRDGARQHAGDVLAGPLVGVLLLAAGELEDDRADIASRGGPERGRGHVEDLRAQVEGRHREAADLAATTGHVELVDARPSRSPAARQPQRRSSAPPRRVASSSVKVAVQTRSRMRRWREARPRRRWTTRRQPSRRSARWPSAGRRWSGRRSVATWDGSPARRWRAWPSVVLGESYRARLAGRPSAASACGCARARPGWRERHVGGRTTPAPGQVVEQPRPLGARAARRRRLAPDPSGQLGRDAPGVVIEAITLGVPGRQQGGRASLHMALRILLERSDVVGGADPSSPIRQLRSARAPRRRIGWHPRSSRRVARRGVPGPPRDWRPRGCAGRSTGASVVDRRHRAPQPGSPGHRIAVGDDERHAAFGEQPDGPRPGAGRWRRRDPADDALGEGCRGSGKWEGLVLGHRTSLWPRRRPSNTRTAAGGSAAVRARGMDVLRFGDPCRARVGQRPSSTRDGPAGCRAHLVGLAGHPACGPSGRTIWSLSPVAS